MHIMAKKGTYARVTHIWWAYSPEDNYIKLLYKKPPGILSVNSAAGVCGQSILEAIRVIYKKERIYI